MVKLRGGILALLTASICCFIINSSGCKKGTPTDPGTDTFFSVTVINQDIFTNLDIGGDVILNGNRQASGGAFSIQSGRINTLDAEVSGYNSGYIVCIDSSGEVIFTRDRDGHHSATVNGDMTFYARLIPENFDTALFAGLGTCGVLAGKRLNKAI